MSKPYTPADLAKRWGVSGKHIRDLCHKGTLSFFKVGKLYRIPAAVVDDFERGGEWNTGSKSTTGNGPLSGEKAERQDADASQDATRTQPSGRSRILRGPDNQSIVIR